MQAGAAFRKVTLKFVPRATQDAKLLPPRWVWSQGGEAMDFKSTLPFTSCVSRKFPKRNLFHTRTWHRPRLDNEMYTPGKKFP